MMQRMLAAARQRDWTFDPLEALARWPADHPIAMLHSGRPHPRWSRYAILARPAATYRLIIDDTGQKHAHWLGTPPPSTLPLSGKPFTDLRTLQHAAGDALWIGYLSYDLGRWAERYAPLRTSDRGFPLIELHHCPDYLVHDNQRGTWFVVGDDHQLPDLAHLPPHHDTFAAGEPQSIVTRAQYEAAVARALRYIAAGDIFQVNLSQRFTAPYTARAPLGQRALFQRLARQSPAWYGAYIELAHDPNDATAIPRAIASTSPELFFELAPDGIVTTRPIKGTRPASTDPAELLHSEKDAAELHMIVDLLRNDLGRVCDYGTVRVVEPRTIESHPTIHHGVATITGRLHPSKDLADLLRATMPGGSITGAPKIRAMQIIDELEPVMRGPYCGCIGMFGRDHACFNIAIRTMLLEQTSATGGRADFSVGGGIVADSIPADEYQETLDKAAALRAALRSDPAPAAPTATSPHPTVQSAAT